MTPLTLNQKNPDELKLELDTLSDRMSELLYQFRILDSHTKMILSKLTLEEKGNSNISIAQAEKQAYIRPEYAKHIEGLCVAESEYSKIKSRYNNLLSYLDLYRSWLVTNRELSR
jgi:hypothetical protein